MQQVDGTTLLNNNNNENILPQPLKTVKNGVNWERVMGKCWTTIDARMSNILRTVVLERLIQTIFDQWFPTYFTFFTGFFEKNYVFINAK